MIGNDCKIEIITDWRKVKQVLLLFNTSFPRSLSDRIGNLDSYAQKLANNAVIHIVSSGNKIIAFAACYCNEILTKQAFLAQIAVRDAYRGLHIGSSLLELCIECSRKLGMEKMILEVDDDNASALKLYAKYGFANPQKATECSHFFEKFL